MTNSKLLKMFLLCFLTFSIFTSCSKEGIEEDGMDEDVNVFNDASDDDDDDDDEIEFEADCFEFVFPVEVQFPDGSTLSFDEESTLEQAIEDWEDMNSGSLEIPLPVYPIFVILDDGSESEVTTDEQFLELMASCEDDDDDDDDDEIEFEADCFEFVFPIEVQFPDGSTLSFDEESTLEQAIEDWEDMNNGSLEIPLPVYPIFVILDDGSESEITTDEQFLELMASCEDDDDDDDEIEFEADCFEFVFPIEVQFPDGSILSFDEENTLEQAIEDWEDMNSGSLEIPLPVYPIFVILDDGSESEITTDEQFLELMASCDDD